MGSNLIHATLPTLLILITMLWIFLKYIYTYSNQTETGSMFTYSNSNTLMVVTFAIILSYAMCMIIMSDQKIDMTLDNKFNFLKKYFPKIAATTLIYYIPIALIDSWYLLLVYVILSPQLYVILIDNIISNDNHKRRLNLKECLRYSIKSWFNYLTLYIILLLFIWVATILVNSPVIGLMTDYLDWHHLFDKRSLNDTFIGSSVNWIILTMLLPLTYYMMRNAYLAIRTKEEAIDLNKKLEKFGLGNSMFEG